MNKKTKIHKGSVRLAIAILSVVNLFLMGPSQPTRAQTAPFLISPYYQTQPITSHFDHEAPNYEKNNVFRRYDGARATNPPTPVDPENCQTGVWCYDGHTGVDFGLDYDPVLAAADGTIRAARWEDIARRKVGLGLYIEIDHGNGYRTIYGHLSATAVSVGSRVVAGQIIGTSGSTGDSGASHLHFEVKYNDIFVDPFGWSGAGNDPWTSATSHCLWTDGEWAAVCGGVKRPIPAPPRGRVMTIDDGDLNFSIGPGGWEADTTCSPPMPLPVPTGISKLAIIMIVMDKMAIVSIPMMNTNKQTIGLSGTPPSPP